MTTLEDIRHPHEFPPSPQLPTRGPREAQPLTNLETPKKPGLNPSPPLGRRHAPQEQKTRGGLGSHSPWLQVSGPAHPWFSHVWFHYSLRTARPFPSRKPEHPQLSAGFRSAGGPWASQALIRQREPFSIPHCDRFYLHFSMPFLSSLSFLPPLFALYSAENCNSLKLNTSNTLTDCLLPSSTSLVDEHHRLLSQERRQPNREWLGHLGKGRNTGGQLGFKASSV